MLCACHGEPAYWQRDQQMKAGGWWRCGEKKRAYQRDRYDRDAIHRIEKRLGDDARSRAKTLKRRKEEHYGEIPPEGLR